MTTATLRILPLLLLLTVIFTLASCGGGSDNDSPIPPAPECATNAECDDAIDCTTDLCTGGTCENLSNDIFCDDNIACTQDSCDGSGCVNTPDDTVCDDNLGGPDFCLPSDPGADANGCVMAVF